MGRSKRTVKQAKTSGLIRRSRHYLERSASLEFEDNIHSVTEPRFLKIGLSRSLKILIVSFCERTRDEHELIRIISARKATDTEKKIYEERI